LDLLAALHMTTYYLVVALKSLRGMRIECPHGEEASPVFRAHQPTHFMPVFEDRERAETWAKKHGDLEVIAIDVKEPGE
jgi:hypothetical protein